MEQLQWHEPRAFNRAEYRDRQKQKPWDAPKTAAICFAVILALRAFAGFNRPNAVLMSWPLSAGIALGLGLFIAYVFPILLSYIALSIVILSAKGVNNNIVGHGATIYFWPWDEIDYCSLGETVRGGKSYPCLFLHDAQGDVLAALALAKKPSAEEVRQWLARNGKLESSGG